MTLFVGIDGGGTGCRAAVADLSGRLLGQGQAGPANIASDADGARRNILAATTEALRAATGSASLSDMAGLVAGLGLAGANAAGAAGAAGHLRLGLPFHRMRIETDAVAAAKGALGAEDGIVAAMGTGSVYAVQRHGQIRCHGGWGLVLGDEGSGAALGRAALARALRAIDGFEPMTAFLQDLLTAHDGPGGVVRFAQTASAADFACLAPTILSSDDPAARSLWADSVAQVERTLERLCQSAPLPVTFIGGLGPFYAAALPRISQRAAKGSALDGALLLAREAA